MDTKELAEKWASRGFNCEEKRLSQAYLSLLEEHSTAQKDNAVLREALEICLGHMTGGMDGNWADCDPVHTAREALSQSLEHPNR